MALALQTTNEKLPDEAIDVLVEAVSRGEHPATIAKRLHPNDRIKRQRVRRQITKAIKTDDRLAEGVASNAQVELMVGLVPAAKALARRAGKGNVPAIKLLNEASGFHNPRVKHEHSGDIKVTLDMPRPKFMDASSIDEPEDADEV